MTYRQIEPNVATVVVPDYSSPTTYAFNTTALTAYQGLAIPKTDSVIDTLGANNTPILAMNVFTRIDSFNLYIETAADSTNADTWVLRFYPVVFNHQLPLSSSLLTDRSYFMFSTEDDGAKVVSRTHPSNTNTIETIMHVDATSTLTTIVGGGSEVSVAITQKVPLVAPYMLIDLTAGANNEISISSLRIWGTRQEE